MVKLIDILMIHILGAATLDIVGTVMELNMSLADIVMELNVS